VICTKPRPPPPYSTKKEGTFICQHKWEKENSQENLMHPPNFASALLVCWFLKNSLSLSLSLSINQKSIEP
jgi:hypothetical protein